MSWDESLFIDGTRLDADITRLVTEAWLVRTMEGAESVELTVSDPDMDFLVSGVLTRRGRASTVAQQLKAAAWERYGRSLLTLDGVFFRFAGVQFQYDTVPWSIILTFESEIAALMRQKTRAVKWSRNKGSRLEFIRYLGTLSQRSDLTEHHIPTFATWTPDSEEENTRQGKVQSADRAKGISSHAHVTVQGVQVDAEQRRNVNTVLTTAQDRNASERVMLALLTAVIQESQVRNLTFGDRDSTGILQVRQSTAQGFHPPIDPRDIKVVVTTFLTKGYWRYGGAISIAAKNPDMRPGDIAQRVQGSGTPDAYKNWETEAQNLLDAWGGASKVTTVRESFEFKAGGPKVGGGHNNYWADSGTLADDRRWRRFASANALYAGPDEWFFKNQPAYVIDGKPGRGQSRKQRLAEQGFLGFTGNADVGMPVSELKLSMLAPRWTTSPGATFEWEHLGALTGRWLIWESRQNITLAVERVELVLRAPQPEKKEPAPTTRTRTEDTPETGTPRDAIVKAAEKTLRYTGGYRYGNDRPYPDHLIPVGPEILHVDCSSFSTLVYKTAGVPDPNGPGYHYNGQTSTQSLRAGGTKTSSPQPGDLVHYGSGAPGPNSHVGVYVGGGKVVEMGGNPGPRKLDVHYRADFAGYWTHDLTET